MNNIAAHGIPDIRALETGDIINIDVTVYLDGFHGDCSETIAVGEVIIYCDTLQFHEAKYHSCKKTKFISFEID